MLLLSAVLVYAFVRSSQLWGRPPARLTEGEAEGGWGPGQALAPEASLHSALQCPQRTLSLWHRPRTSQRHSSHGGSQLTHPGLAEQTLTPLVQSDCSRGVPRTPLRSPVQKRIIGLVPLDEYGPNRTCGCGHEQMAPRTVWTSRSTEFCEEAQEGSHSSLTHLVQRVRAGCHLSMSLALLPWTVSSSYLKERVK